MSGTVETKPGEIFISQVKHNNQWPKLDGDMNQKISTVSSSKIYMETALQMFILMHLHRKFIHPFDES